MDYCNLGLGLYNAYISPIKQRHDHSHGCILIMTIHLRPSLQNILLIVTILFSYPRGLFLNLFYFPDNPRSLGHSSCMCTNTFRLFLGIILSFNLPTTFFTFEVVCSSFTSSGGNRCICLRK